eukprot:4877597-Prymnesium_polylepis.1
MHCRAALVSVHYFVAALSICKRKRRFSDLSEVTHPSVHPTSYQPKHCATSPFGRLRLLLSPVEEAALSDSRQD